MIITELVWKRNWLPLVAVIYPFDVCRSFFIGHVLMWVDLYLWTSWLLLYFIICLNFSQLLRLNLIFLVVITWFLFLFLKVRYIQSYNMLLPIFCEACMLWISLFHCYIWKILVTSKPMHWNLKNFPEKKDMWKLHNDIISLLNLSTKQSYCCYYFFIVLLQERSCFWHLDGLPILDSWK